MNITVGNAHEAETNGTGWFIGFSAWTRTGGSDLLHVPKDQLLSGLSVKWFEHPSGDESGSKPVSEGRTVSILASSNSAFRIEFSASPEFAPGEVKTVLLQRHGDYAAWGEGLHHRWYCESQATIITLRWNNL